MASTAQEVDQKLDQSLVDKKPTRVGFNITADGNCGLYSLGVGTLLAVKHGLVDVAGRKGCFDLFLRYFQAFHPNFNYLAKKGDEAVKISKLEYPNKVRKSIGNEELRHQLNWQAFKHWIAYYGEHRRDAEMLLGPVFRLIEQVSLKDSKQGPYNIKHLKCTTSNGARYLDVESLDGIYQALGKSFPISIAPKMLHPKQSLTTSNVTEKQLKAKHRGDFPLQYVDIAPPPPQLLLDKDLKQLTHEVPSAPRLDLVLNQVVVENTPDDFPRVVARGNHFNMQLTIPNTVREADVKAIVADAHRWNSHSSNPKQYEKDRHEFAASMIVGDEAAYFKAEKILPSLEESYQSRVIGQIRQKMRLAIDEAKADVKSEAKYSMDALSSVEMPVMRMGIALTDLYNHARGFYVEAKQYEELTENVITPLKQQMVKLEKIYGELLNHLLLPEDKATRNDAKPFEVEKVFSYFSKDLETLFTNKQLEDEYFNNRIETIRSHIKTQLNELQESLDEKTSGWHLKSSILSKSAKNTTDSPWFNAKFLNQNNNARLKTAMQALHTSFQQIDFKTHPKSDEMKSLATDVLLCSFHFERCDAENNDDKAYHLGFVANRVDNLYSYLQRHDRSDWGKAVSSVAFVVLSIVLPIIGTLANLAYNKMKYGRMAPSNLQVTAYKAQNALVASTTSFTNNAKSTSDESEVPSKAVPSKEDLNSKKIQLP